MSEGRQLGNNLSQQDREHLMRLRWLWEKGYQIDTDGETWTAHPRTDWDNVLEAPTHTGLWNMIKVDNAERRDVDGRDGYWVETCSGPPYKVRTPPAPYRGGNSA